VRDPRVGNCQHVIGLCVDLIKEHGEVRELEIVQCKFRDLVKQKVT